MASNSDIQNLIPEGCRYQYNAKGKCFYVFKSTYYYDRTVKRSKEKRVSVGVVRDGKFTYAKRYLLEQQFLEQSKAKTQKSEKQSATAMGRKVIESAEKKVVDNRQRGKVIYPIGYVYLVALLSSLTGQSSCVQIADYWKNHRETLESIFEDFPKEDISHDTVRRVLMLVEPEQMKAFYDIVVTPLIEKTGLRIVSADGQAIRASKTTKFKSGKYILSFYDSDNGVVLGQKLIGEKENEITHAATMAEMLDLDGTVVTADALNTQTKFAKTLIDRGADYCLALKDNHKTLFIDCQLAFLDPTEQRTQIAEKVELDHGRIETRTISVLPGTAVDKKHFASWIGLEEGTIVKATTSVINKKTGKESSMDRFFISSLRWDNPEIVSQLERAVRRHWAVENDLHYVLDVDFNQDRTQCKNANYLHNRVLMNKLSVAIINKWREMPEFKNLTEKVSRKRIMCKLQIPTVGLRALDDVLGK